MNRSAEHLGVHDLASVPHLGANLGMDLDELRYRPIYELGSTHMSIDDPVWGHEDIGEDPFDQVLIELAHTDALRRLQTIEQLTLPERYSTIPDSYYFSRWEHAWGSLIFTRRMAKMMGMDAKESMYLQLKVLLSDFKHTAFSHAGDWLFEDEGGSEKTHENRRDYSDAMGITRLIELHGFDARWVFDDSKNDITDMPPTELDGDRIDYTMREGNRWVDQSPVYKQYLNKDSFEVVNGRIVAKNLMVAKMLTMCHAILVTEYWHDPVERMQLGLQQELLKRTFVSVNGHRTDWGTYSPRDLMMTSDHTLIERMNKHDEFTHILDGIMQSVAESERTIHWRHRRDYIRQLLDKTAGQDTAPIDWVKDYYNVLPASCEVDELELAGTSASNERMIRIKLAAHRERYLNPAFIDKDGSVRTLREADPEFWQLVQEMFKPTRKDWQATLVQNKATTKMLRECIETNEKEWPGVMKRPPLSSSAFRQLLRNTVETSLPYSAKFIDFHLVA